MNDSSQFSLADLLQQCKNRQDAAWHRLIDLIAPVIFAICRKSHLSRDESFDIYGQVCLELINSIDTLLDPKKIYGFVATITRRQIYSYYNSMRINEFLRNNDYLTVESEEFDADQAYLNLKKRDLLLDALQNLSKRERHLLRLLFFDSRGLSYKEISRTMNIPESSIGPTRARALMKLYRKLKGRF